ncbi:MAG: PAS domain-containing sensor histidine kinase [Pseudomonadota bacterium]
MSKNSKKIVEVTGLRFKQRTAKELLHQSKELYYAVVKQMAEAIFLFDVESRHVLESNPAAEKLLSYTAEELRNLTIYDYIDHTRENIDHLIERVLQEEQLFHGIRRYRRKNGLIVNVEVNAKHINYDGKNVICVVARDITERIEVENALRQSEEKLRDLSLYLLNFQESERKRISKELHDELGQALMMLKFQVKSLQEIPLGKRLEFNVECEKIQNYLNQIIENIRRISRDLSPTILEDLGLSAALRLMVNDISRYYHLESKVEIQEIDKLMSKKSQVIIYRVFQEALTNIGKHAHATKLYVDVIKKNKSLDFIIEDNGIGFDLKIGKKYNGMGITTMSERVRMIGGELSILTEKGTGTKLAYTIPFEFSENKQ